MKERLWLVLLLCCGAAAAGGWLLAQQPQTLHAQELTKADPLAAYVGQECIVHIRRDVLAGLIEIPLPKTISDLGRERLSLEGELVLISSDWVVIEYDRRQRFCLPRETVLMVELAP